MEWTDEKVITLIDKYRENEVLWNVKLTDYRNKIKKNDAWKRLATEMKCSRVEIEKKMKTLLAQFRRERQKAEKMKKSGMGTDEIYATTWFGFKAFSFLYDKNTPMETKDTLQEENNAVNNGSEISADEEEETTAENTSEFNAKNIPPVKTSSKRNKRTADPRLDEAYTIMQNLNQKATERDECSLYGEQLAIILRKMDERTRLILQHKINMLVFETEMSVIPFGSHLSQISAPLSIQQPSSSNSTVCSTPIMSPNSQNQQQFNQMVQRPSYYNLERPHSINSAPCKTSFVSPSPEPQPLQVAPNPNHCSQSQENVQPNWY